MATYNFANINEENLIKTINSYFRDLTSDKTNTDILTDKNPMVISDQKTLKTKVFLHILNDVLNKIIEEDSIEIKDSFFKFILKENKLSIIIKNIYINICDLLKSSNYNRTHFYSNLISKFGSLAKINSDIDLEFILSCEILKYFSFEVFRQLIANINDLRFEVKEIIEYKRSLKSLYFNVCNF